MELLPNLTGTWKLDKASSDSLEPLLAFVGLSWLIRKAALAAPAPLQIIEVLSDGMNVQMKGSAANSYKWGSDNIHISPGGKSAATLTKNEQGTSATLQVASLPNGKGDIITVYEAFEDKNKMISYIKFTDNGKDICIKRCYNRV